MQLQKLQQSQEEPKEKPKVSKRPSSVVEFELQKKIDDQSSEISLQKLRIQELKSDLKGGQRIIAE